MLDFFSDWNLTRKLICEKTVKTLHFLHSGIEFLPTHLTWFCWIFQHHQLLQEVNDGGTPNVGIPRSMAGRFFHWGFPGFSSLLIFFFRVQTNFWPVCGVRLVGCKGTTWKFAVIWNSPTCWTPRPQQSQHLRAAAAHQASIVPVLRASRIVDLQKNFNGKKPAVVAGDMLWSNVLFTF